MRANTWLCSGASEESRLRNIYRDISSRRRLSAFNSSIESPGYTALMTATDGKDENWSFLASEMRITTGFVRWNRRT
jgi:hypothetical protein